MEYYFTAFHAIGAFAIGVFSLMFGYYQKRISSLYKRIERVEETSREQAEKIRGEALAAINALSTSFNEFKSDINQKMITRGELREDLRELKADLMTNFTIAIKSTK